MAIKTQTLKRELQEAAESNPSEMEAQLLLDQMEAAAKPAPRGETGMKPGDVVQRSMDAPVASPFPGEGETQETVPMPMKVFSIEGDDDVWIYDTETGAPSRAKRNMLRRTIQKRRPDGKLMWTTTDPGKRPPVGQYKCLLHPDQPERKHYDELGLPVCDTPNIPSPYQVELHMMRKHTSAWKAIEREREQREREEERELRQKQMEAMQALASKST